MQERRPIQFMELHNSIFIKGKQFAPKVDPLQVAGLRVEYDPETRFVYIHWKDAVATLPLTSVMYFIEGEPERRVESTVIQHPKARVTAQVSGPTHHVHAGPGAGKTGKE